MYPYECRGRIVAKGMDVENIAENYMTKIKVSHTRISETFYKTRKAREWYSKALAKRQQIQNV